MTGWAWESNLNLDLVEKAMFLLVYHGKSPWKTIPFPSILSKSKLNMSRKTSFSNDPDEEWDMNKNPSRIFWPARFVVVHMHIFNL